MRDRRRRSLIVLSPLWRERVRNFTLAVALVTAGLIVFGALDWVAVIGIGVIAVSYLVTDGD